MGFVMLHYDEIALKKGNRAGFEAKLVENLKSMLPKVKVIKERGQIIINTGEIEHSEAKSILSCMPGIAYFSFAEEANLDINYICKRAVELLKEKKGTFRITTKRHNKNFGMNSQDVSMIVGECVLNSNPELKVKMKNADYDLKIEVCNKQVYLSLENVMGIGGLPVGTAGKVLCLLSGGIDSPVSAYMMMKRGVKAEFIHFQNKTQQTKSVQGKIEKLVKELSKFQVTAKLYVVPFDDIQKEIIKSVNSKLRMLVYRRLMFMIAEKIANREKIKALVTGDSLAQVASQTMFNMEAVYAATSKLVFAPLIGLNKAEIVDIARKINTYDISILPYGDCCSYFVAEHPETAGNADILEEAESRIDKDKLITEAIQGTEVIKF